MNKLFAILIMCSLSLPVLAIEEQEVSPTPINEEKLEEIQPEEIGEVNTPIIESDLPATLPSRYKEPIGKKKLAKKFLVAMLCVAGTSMFLYVTLSLYNRIRDGVVSQGPIPPEGEKPLDAPCDLTDAVKTFVEKTHWKG